MFNNKLIKGLRLEDIMASYPGLLVGHAGEIVGSDIMQCVNYLVTISKLSHTLAEQGLSFIK